MFSRKLIVALTGFMLWSAIVAAEVFIIPLQHLTPQELIPIVQPFLKADDSLVAGHDELILRTDPRTRDDIERIVRQYDQALPRLMIYVRTAHDHNSSDRGLHGRVDARIGSGSVHSIRGQARSYSNRDQQTGNRQQFIQVLDGYPAYISYGRRTPYSETRIVENAYDFFYLSSTTRFDEATSGFTVTPHIVGNQVQLSIEHWTMETRQIDGAPQTISSAATVIRGDLDTWIMIGGQSARGREQQEGLLSRRYSSQSDTMQIEVKVSHLLSNLP